MKTARELHRELKEIMADPNRSRMHYVSKLSEWCRQAAAEGTPIDALVRPDLSDEDRFWDHVIQGSDHWYWSGPTYRGSPAIKIRAENGDRRVRTLRRWMWTEILGRDPAPRHRAKVDAACGEPTCIRPSHLALFMLDTERYSEQEILDKIRRFARELGHSPTVADWREAGLRPHESLIRKRFGLWSIALAQAGLEARRRETYLEEDLLAHLREVISEFGPKVSASEWTAIQRERGLPNQETYVRRFGTWNKAKEAVVNGEIGTRVEDTMGSSVATGEEARGS